MMLKQINNKIITLPLSENIQVQREENLNKLGQEGYILSKCISSEKHLTAFLKKDLMIDYVYSQTSKHDNKSSEKLLLQDIDVNDDDWK